MTVIAMTREMGSRGKEVAEILTERLSSTLVYHELVEEGPDRMGGAEPGEVRRFLHGREEAGQAAPGRHGRMTPEQVLEVARPGNVIIRGWGPVRLLHSIPHVLCVRVCAPMKARISEMARRLGVPADVARREIEHSDAAHTGIFARLFETDWRDALNYDLVLNTARLAPQLCADIIIGAAASPAFRETDESRQLLADRLTEARIAALLRSDPVISSLSTEVQVFVAEGKATLCGVVPSAGAAEEIERLVRARANIESIQNDLQVMGSHVDEGRRGSRV